MIAWSCSKVKRRNLSRPAPQEGVRRFPVGRFFLSQRSKGGIPDRFRGRVEQGHSLPVSVSTMVLIRFLAARVHSVFIRVADASQEEAGMEEVLPLPPHVDPTSAFRPHRGAGSGPGRTKKPGSHPVLRGKTLSQGLAQDFGKGGGRKPRDHRDRKSTRLNSSHA